jgi:hypothetical protein
VLGTPAFARHVETTTVKELNGSDFKNTLPAVVSESQKYDGQIDLF